MKSPKGTESLASGKELGKVGTKATGFDSHGPYSCMSCIHRTPHSKNEEGELVDSCSHPSVMADPELQDRKLPDGTISVDFDDCCELVRPEDLDSEEEG